MSAAQIEHGFAGLHILRGIAAAVVLVDHLLRDDLEQVAIIFDRAAERCFRCFGGGGVAQRDGSFVEQGWDWLEGGHLNLNSELVRRRLFPGDARRESARLALSDTSF